jgi:hypothetical protein
VILAAVGLYKLVRWLARDKTPAVTVEAPALEKKLS